MGTWVHLIRGPRYFVACPHRARGSQCCTHSRQLPRANHPTTWPFPIHHFSFLLKKTFLPSRWYGGGPIVRCKACPHFCSSIHDLTGKGSHLYYCKSSAKPAGSQSAWLPPPPQANEGSRQPGPSVVASKPFWGSPGKLQFYGCSVGCAACGWMGEERGEPCWCLLPLDSLGQLCCTSGGVSPQHALRAAAVGEGMPVTTLRNKGLRLLHYGVWCWVTKPPSLLSAAQWSWLLLTVVTLYTYVGHGLSRNASQIGNQFSNNVTPQSALCQWLVMLFLTWHSRPSTIQHSLATPLTWSLRDPGFVL